MDNPGFKCRLESSRVTSSGPFFSYFTARVCRPCMVGTKKGVQTWEEIITGWGYVFRNVWLLPRQNLLIQR